MRFGVLILFLLIQCFGNAQNLIPNPGFEETSGCPGASVWLRHTDHWYNLPNHNGSADQYYGDCDYNGIINPMAPNQRPFEGQGYGGGFCFYGQYDQGEYLCIELNESMMKDSVYYIEFYVLPSPKYPNFIDSYGAHFSVAAPTGNGNGLKTQTQFEEHIGNPRGQLIKDTINWTKISGLYTAKGGEKYMTLGNFRNTAQTKYLSYDRNNHTNIHSAYFFVDGVGVKLDDGHPFEWEINEQPNNLISNDQPDQIPKDTVEVDITDERVLKIKADFITTQRKVKLEIWDHQQIDNDTIDVMLDDTYLAKSLPLKRKKKRITLELEPGTYIFKTNALNLGDVPPNTTAVRIKDGEQTKLFILNSDLEETEALRFIVK